MALVLDHYFKIDRDQFEYGFPLNQLVLQVYRDQESRESMDEFSTFKLESINCEGIILWLNSQSIDLSGLDSNLDRILTIFYTYLKTLERFKDCADC